MGNQLTSQIMEECKNGICQQCSRPFSEACKRKVYCGIHNGHCFECEACIMNGGKAINDIVPCCICARLISIDEAYLDFLCDAYICKNQFVNLDLKKETIRLPCGKAGHEEERKHIINFMSSFCFNCGRKVNQSSSETINQCNACKQRDIKLPKIDFARPETQMPTETKNTTEILQKPIEMPCIKQQTESAIPIVQERQDQNAIIQLLEKDLQLIQTQLTVSEYSRKKLRKLITDRQKDVDCPLCLQPFDTLNRKPMMICMRQHLLCQNCLKINMGKMLKCLVCQDPIQLQKASVCRREIKLIQIQQRSKLSYKDAHEELVKARLLLDQIQILEAKASERQVTINSLVDAEKKKKELQQKMQAQEKEQDSRSMKSSEKGKKTRASNRKAANKPEPKAETKTKQIKKQVKKQK